MDPLHACSLLISGLYCPYESKEKKFALTPIKVNNRLLHVCISRGHRCHACNAGFLTHVVVTGALFLSSLRRSPACLQPAFLQSCYVNPTRSNNCAFTHRYSLLSFFPPEYLETVIALFTYSAWLCSWRIVQCSKLSCYSKYQEPLKKKLKTPITRMCWGETIHTQVLLTSEF